MKEVLIATAFYWEVIYVAVALTMTLLLQCRQLFVSIDLFSVIVTSWVGIGAALKDSFVYVRDVFSAVLADKMFYVSSFEAKADKAIVHTEIVVRKLNITLPGAALFIVISSSLIVTETLENWFAHLYKKEGGFV